MVDFNHNDITGISIMRHFDKMKMELLEVKKANGKLEETVEVLRQRLEESEEKKGKLITLFKEITSSSKNKESRVEQLQADYENIVAENVHLKSLIQAKDVKILDLEDTITKLNGQILMLKLDKGTKPKAKRPRAALKVIKKNENSNASFDHPSFYDGTKSSVKKSTKKMGQSYPQLDLTYRDENTSSSSDNTWSSKSDRRRKLFVAHDDECVDLDVDM